MPPRAIVPILLLPLAAALSAQSPSQTLTQVLESQLAGFPARTGRATEVAAASLRGVRVG